MRAGLSKAMVLILALCIMLISAIPTYAAEIPFGGINSVAAGGAVSAYLDKDGTLWTWGANDLGQLGDGTTEDRRTPKAILNNIVSVAAGYQCTAAIDKDGGLWVWGQNHYGCLGLGPDVEFVTTPVKIMDNVATIRIYNTGTNSNTVVIDTNGGLWMAGKNAWSQILGTSNRNISKFVKVMDNIVDAIPGYHSTTALDKNGDFWFWGDNYYGYMFEMQPQENNYVLKPMKIASNVRAISGNSDTIAYIDNDDVLWVRGYNTTQLLDIYNTAQYGTYGTIIRTPLKVSENVKSVEVGDGHASFIDNNGGLWIWGGNSSGALGDGTYESRLVPIKLMDNIATISSSNHNLALDMNGGLWTWGLDSVGQLGQIPGVFIRSDNVPEKFMEGIPLPYNFSAKAMPASAKVIIDGSVVSFEAYTIYNENYFKLRDIAKALGASAKRFDVTWDDTNKAISIVPGRSYTEVGGELAAGDGTSKNAKLSNTSIAKQGEKITLTSFGINGNNYFNLKDLAEAIDFRVSRDAGQNAIIINTNTN